MLGILQKNRLQINIKKCKFHVEKVLYLSIIVDKHSIKIDPAKVAIIKKWARPGNIKDI